MANLQKYFEKYHGAIRLDVEQNSELAAKREIVLDLVRDYLKANELPGFTRLLQGSYAVSTGVKPLDDEYDIDVGLVFEIDPGEYDAETVRTWVLEAVDGHTENVKARGPCIRVTYAKGFHLDLVVYAEHEGFFVGKYMKLAHRDKGWVSADPRRLNQFILDAAAKFDGTEGNTGIDQLRRAIRYLKRWSDVLEPAGGKEQPSGLAYTLLAIGELTEKKESLDGASNDLDALHAVATGAAERFFAISASKPTPEYEDMFGKLDSEQHSALKKSFRTLADVLKGAADEVDPVVACESIAELLGDDFPVPSAEETAKRLGAPAIISTSSSA